MESTNQNQLPEMQFNQLSEPPALNQDLISQINYAIKSSNWTDSYQCVTMIRSIIKFYPQFIDNILDKYSSPLLDLISHGKTQIVKNILKLIKQVFSMGKQINVENSVHIFLPVLLKKASNQIGHIKDISQQILTIFSLNCGYNISFDITAQSCCDKNAQISQISIKLLANLIQNIGASIMQLNPNTLQTIMRAMYFLIDGKRANMKTWTLDICMFIYNAIGTQNYLSLMNFALHPNEVDLMGKSMETHRVSKSKPLSLSNVLKQRRTMQVKQGQGFESQNCYLNNNYQQNNGFN